MTLVLAAEQAAVIRRQGEADYPNETCGLIGGRVDGDRGIVMRLVPLPNERQDSLRNRYLIDPDAFRRAQLELDRAQLDVLGVYHSHPDHPAEPSTFDREHAWPRLSYVIVGVARGRAGDLRSWRLADDRSAFAEEPIIVEEREVAWQSRS